MRFLFFLLLVFAVTCVIFDQDVFTDGSLSDTGHKSLAALKADYNNAKLEQERFQGRINSYVSERNRYISLANDLKGRGSGSLGSLQTILISSLSSATQTTLANTAGLTLRAFLSSYGSSSLASAVDSAISTAATNHSAAESAYNNANRTPEYGSANSAIEAWYENGRAADHHNEHVSPGEYLLATPSPDGPSDINFPTFECPGTCTNRYSTVWEAINVHYEECGTAEPVSPLLSFAEQQAILAARSVSDGCGVEYYSCGSDEGYHRIRTCTKGVWATRYTDYTNGTERYRSHTCGDSFRNCMPHKDYHKSSTFKTVHSDSETDDPAGSTSPSVSKPPPPPPPPSPSYHACGDHETSVSGDHSLQASCSSTDSNGNSCTVASFYACDNHSHVYPVPSIVACGGASYTGCSGASSRTEHHVSSCSSGCGNGYWTCSPTAVYDHETTFTCRRCGTSFTRCSNGTCTSNGNTYTYHWAQ